MIDVTTNVGPGARAAHALADLVGGVGSGVRETAVQTSSID